MTTFITTLMSILNLVMMNPNIPQETKDQIFSQTITAIEQGFKQEEPVHKQVQAPVTIVEPVAFSAPVEPTFVVPVATTTATSNATTTQYVAGTVRVEGGKFIFNKGDSDLFRTKFTLIKGDGIEEGKPHYMVSDLRGAKNNYQEQEEDLTTSETEGTLWMYSSRNGHVLDERTYTFKVEGGVATLY